MFVALPLTLPAACAALKHKSAFKRRRIKKVCNLQCKNKLTY